MLRVFPSSFGGFGSGLLLLNYLTTSLTHLVILHFIPYIPFLFCFHWHLKAPSFSGNAVRLPMRGAEGPGSVAGASPPLMPPLVTGSCASRSKLLRPSLALRFVCALDLPCGLQRLMLRFCPGKQGGADSWRLGPGPARWCLACDSVSECLRRWTRNPLGSARRGSNPLAVVFACQLVVYCLCVYFRAAGRAPAASSPEQICRAISQHQQGAVHAKRQRRIAKKRVDYKPLQWAI